MKDIVIFGAGGLGRETLFTLRELQRQSDAYHILGFADDRLYGGTADEMPVLHTLSTLRESSTPLCVAIALGDPAARRRVHDALAENPLLSFPTILAPGVICSDRVRMGEGCIVGFGAILTVDIEIGNFVLVSNACTIGHDAVLHDFATLYPGARVSGNVTLGEGCLMGVGSSIIQGLQVGEGAVVGAGAAVVRSIPAHCTAVGVPARPIRFHNRTV